MILKRAIIIALAVLGATCSPALKAQEDFMYWEGNFSAISLLDLTTADAVSTGNSTVRLHMSGNVTISADNTGAARLCEPGGGALVTEYQLSFDGDGQSATGASTVNYTSYESFLSPPVQVTHVAGDDEVEVTLYARARNPSGEAANAGSYSATQTLTVSWAGP